jgi:hypothetical protein
LLGFTLAAVSSLTAPAAGATAQSSFVYCISHDGAKIFAGRVEPNGSLLFGVSVWSPEGQNISVFGVAARQKHSYAAGSQTHNRTGLPATPAEWQYTETLHAAAPADRCRLDIEHPPDGTLRISADPHATCQSHGGVNTEIGNFQFPRTAYEGPVTTELNDPESFQRAGKCVGSQH